MLAILKQTGGLTAQLRVRAEQVFAAIDNTGDVAAMRRGLEAQALRLETRVRHLRLQCAWYTSLLPPAGGETLRQVENRALRQLWQQYSHLGVEAFCEQFKIARPSFYRRLGFPPRVQGGLSIARGGQVRYNRRQQSTEALLKPAAPGSPTRSLLASGMPVPHVKAS
jgi:hypothetical protein